jgi:tetratricopeptide (TPR) repeat protein
MIAPKQVGCRWASGWLVLLLGLAALPGWGAAPPAPSGKLTAAQQKRLDQLDEELTRAAHAGKMGEALRLAKEIEALRRRCQGARHWQTINAGYEVERWVRLARLSAAEQREAARALLREAEARGLAARHRYAEAEKALRDVLAIHKRLLGEEHPTTALSYNSLAYNLHAQGKYREAQPLLQKALELRQKVLGEEHPETAQSYNNLAAILNAQGKHRQAQPLYQKALELRQKVLGEEHPDTASSYNNLATNFSAQGKYAQAQPLFQKALELRTKLLGEQHLDTAQSYNNLAYILDAQGKHREAQPLYRKALDLYQKLLGEEHPETALSYNNLAANLDAQGKYGEAQPLYQKALELREKVLGEEHPHTASSYNNLAYNLNAQGKHREAQPLYRKALDLYQKVLGEEHPHTAQSYNNLAYTLNAQGKHREAQPLYRKALELRQKLLGEHHPATAASYNNLAVNFNAQGKYALAQPLLQKALDLHKKVLGEQHPATAAGYNNLAANLNAQGKYALAQPLYQKALDLHKKVLGEEHPHTAFSYNNLGYNLASQGKHREAQPLYWKALALRQKLLGEEHPDTSASCNNLAYNLYAQGKHREAIRSWQAALLGHDAGSLARASSGFDRALWGANFYTPRQGLVLAHARLNEPVLAWQHAEADLARGLLDDLGAALDEDVALAGQLHRLDQRLLPLLASAKLSADQQRLRRELTGQRRDLLTRLARDVATRSAGRVWSLERIQKHLPADAALVLWVSPLGENWGCVLRARGEPRWQRLPGSGPKGRWTEEDYQQPERLRAALADRHSSASRRRELTEAVRRRWLAPLVKHLGAEGKLPAARRLFVVPSGYLSSLPVEEIAPEWTVSYTSSGTLLAQTLARHRPLRATAVLALGDPAFAPARVPEAPACGLLVSRVLPGGSAARAGLHSGDVLLRFAGSKLNTLADLVAAVKRTPKGEAVVWREGKERTVALGSPLGVWLDKRPVGEALRAWRTLHQPVLRSARYQPLPGTRHEVEALRRLLGKRCRTLLGSEASEQQLDALARAGQLERFRVIHFATHGKIDLGRPTHSALLLARDRLPSADEQVERARRGLKVYTGELRVGTILREWQGKLDADLVVLSACDTALGRPTSSQGLLGFAYALQVAGARSVVLSRWKVDDTATTLLMLRFYENLLGKRKGTKAMGRAAALDEARRWLRGLRRKQALALAGRRAGGALRGSEEEVPALVEKEAAVPAGDRPFAHPAFWAAFTLLGDPD